MRKPSATYNESFKKALRGNQQNKSTSFDLDPAYAPVILNQAVSILCACKAAHQRTIEGGDIKSFCLSGDIEIKR